MCVVDLRFANPPVQALAAILAVMCLWCNIWQWENGNTGCGAGGHASAMRTVLCRRRGAMASENGDRATYLSALQALQAASTSETERKRANDWLMSFQRNPACWGVAMQLLQDANAAPDAQLFAAQTIKARARLLRSAPVDQLQQMQRDILNVMAQVPNASTQRTRQLCLALVDTSLPSLDTLGHLISHLTAAMPTGTALLAIEYLADGASSLTHFGTGRLGLAAA